MTTKENIIKSAFNVFITNGLFNTKMDDIAKEANLTRRTLYRYFDTKESLAYEVMITLLNRWNDFQRSLMPKLTGCGLDRIEQFLTYLIDFLQDNMDILSFSGDFDQYFKDTTDQIVNNDMPKQMNDVNHIFEDILDDLITQGIEDNSIKLLFDKDLLITTISNVLWICGQRISIRKDILATELNRDPIDIIKCQIDIYLQLLRQ